MPTLLRLLSQYNCVMNDMENTGEWCDIHAGLRLKKDNTAW